MPPKLTPRLSRREREVVDIVYARRITTTAAEVRDAMHDAPTDAAVRTTLRILVAKGHLQIEQDGPRYDYWPTVSPERARTFGAAAHPADFLRRIHGSRSGYNSRHPVRRAGRRRSGGSLKQLIDKAAKTGR